ncbi:MAG: FxLYD domain-containing protein [Promethearchaeota archaeon]
MNSKLAIAAILVATIPGLVGTYYYLPLRSASTREVLEAPKALKILSDISYIDQVESEKEIVTFFVVAGVIENNLSTNVCSVNVTAMFYDAEGKMIENSSLLGHIELEIIEPGERAPFEIYLLLGSSTSIPSRYEVTASCFETDEEPVRGVEVINQTASFDKEGYHKVVGEVQNNWKTKAVAVKVICAYYNATDYLIAMSHAHVSTAIDSGAKATFELSSKPFEISPASYELFIVVHHYTQLPLSNFVLFTAMVVAFVIFIAYMKRRGW